MVKHLGIRADRSYYNRMNQMPILPYDRGKNSSEPEEINMMPEGEDDSVTSVSASVCVYGNIPDTNDKYSTASSSLQVVPNKSAETRETGRQERKASALQLRSESCLIKDITFPTQDNRSLIDISKPEETQEISAVVGQPDDTTEGHLCPSNWTLSQKNNCRAAPMFKESEDYILQKIENQCKCPGNCHILLMDIQQHHKKVQICSSNYCKGPVHIDPALQNISRLNSSDVEKLSNSVGLLVYYENGDDSKEHVLGTCFCTGVPGIVITCFHVMYNVEVFTEGDFQQYLEQVHIFALFDKKVRKFPIKPDIQHACVADDYILLHLLSPDEAFPPPIEDFGSVSCLNFPIPVCVFGYQNGRLNIDNEAYLLGKNSKSMTKLYISNACDPGKRILLSSRLVNGASGGMGVCLNERGYPTVVLMYKGGFPSEYYRLPCREKLKFASCYIWEQGVGIAHIYGIVDRVCRYDSNNTELPSNLFPGI